MMNLFRLIFAIFIIVLIVPQTPKENIVLRALHSRRILANYGEEKRFLMKFTWFSILFFLLIGFFTSLN
jgi:preprotein translocase subunit SecG